MRENCQIKKEDEMALIKEGELVYLPDRFGFTAPGVYLYRGVVDGVVTLSLGNYSMTLPKEALVRLRPAEYPEFEATVKERIKEFEHFVQDLEKEASEVFSSFEDDFFEVWSVDAPYS